MVELTLDQMFQKARSTCSDINEHCDKLRELASQAGSVVELGMRHGVSTVALLAGQPQKMISYDLNHDSVADPLKSRQGKTAFWFVQGDSLSVDIESCDLLFIDTRHTADQLTRKLQRHAGKVRQRASYCTTPRFSVSVVKMAVPVCWWHCELFFGSFRNGLWSITRRRTMG
jgi:DNA-binding IclR family transcriptional regulator